MNPSTYTPLLVAGTFAVFLAVERFFPLRARRSAMLPRLAVNLGLSGFAFFTAFAVVRPSTLHALGWVSQTPFGILSLVPGPASLRFLLGFLLLDLSFYYWHTVNHKIPFLWRFHNVHHIDPDLDVSTAFRFHFGEILLSTFFRVTQVSLIGMSFATFAAYELVFQANTLFHHSNLRLPIRLERLLNRVLVTPRMHGIHHSQVRRESNSNFGVVFCWWDRLHRTLGLNIPQSKIQIGIAGYSAPQDNRFWHSFTLPFRKQRDYWRTPDGRVPERMAADLRDNPDVLAG